VYSNRKIPDIWKNKIGYQDEVLDVLKDEQFLVYLGRSNPKDDSFSTTTASTKQMAKTAYSSFPKLRKLSQNEQLTHISEGIQSLTNRDESEVQTRSITNRPKYTMSLKPKKEVNEKEIVSILEDFRSLYPIKTNNFQAVITNIDGNNKVGSGACSGNGVGSSSKDLNMFNKTFTSSFKGGFRSGSMPNIINQGLHGIKHLKPYQKQEMFKQAIYNKLIPSKQKLSFSSRNIQIPKKHEEEKTSSTKYGPFLNSDNEIFNRKIEITNPLVKKHLESINYFGPYYSYCPPCRNRNMEYYKNLEPNQCIEIIKCIKKEKKRKAIELEEHYKKELKLSKLQEQ
jgi:hypothetical protein